MFDFPNEVIKHLTTKPYCMILRFKIYFRFPTELNVGEVSAQVFWDMFCSDLQDMLKGSEAECTYIVLDVNGIGVPLTPR